MTQKSPSNKKRVWSEIIARREKLPDGSVWPREEWDYTEWEEAFEELKTRTKSVSTE